MLPLTPDQSRLSKTDWLIASLLGLTFATVLFVVNVAIMLIIGYFQPRKDAYIQKYSREVDITPWKYLYIMGGTIILIVLLVYYYFS